MDITQRPISWQFRKTLKYLGLYGISRTISKIRSQYHMKRVFNPLPPSRPLAGNKAHVGIVGCGKFAFSTVAYFLHKNFGRVIHSAMDININRAVSLYQTYSLNKYSSDVSELLCDPAVDLIFVVSNHASHAEYAISALDAGKSVHIEKPHVVTVDQLTRLCTAMRRSKGLVRLGFNRPCSTFGREIKVALAEQSGPIIMNWFIAGHELGADHWYLSDQEGGRVLGNLCHWIDFAYQMIEPKNRYPIEIRPVRTKSSSAGIVLSLCFGDGSVATFTFAEVGTMDGVRERLHLHKGRLLVTMEDFHRLTLEVGDTKKVLSLWGRDHGHENSVVQSYRMVRPKEGESTVCTLPYVWEIGELALKAKEAVETDRTITVDAYRVPDL